MDHSLVAEPDQGATVGLLGTGPDVFGVAVPRGMNHNLAAWIPGDARRLVPLLEQLDTQGLALLSDMLTVHTTIGCADDKIGGRR